MHRLALRISYSTLAKAPNAGHFIFGRALMSCSAFAAVAVQLQNNFLQRKTKDIQGNGRHLFDIEKLDDVDFPQSTMTNEIAMNIVNAATTLRIRPTVGKAFSSTVQWALKPNVVANMSPEALSRIMHSCVVLHSPLLFDVLTVYVWRVIDMAPTFPPTVCSVIINAYGRSGFVHKKLYEKLGARVLEIASDSAITIPHVANMLYALSRVEYENPTVYRALQDQTLKLKSDASPLIIASILDSFATVGIIDEDFFETFERGLLESIEQCSAPLVASIINTLVKAKRTNSASFKLFCKRAAKITSTMSSADISRIMESLHQANIADDDLLGALAERSCKITQEFRVIEAKQTLETLSSFVLYDPELFPLLGSRVSSILRGRGVYDVDSVASILASFAAVHERHEDLIYVGARVLADSAENMSPRSYINALYAFSVHNVKSENQRRIVESCKLQMPLLEAEAKRDAVMLSRLDVGKKTYFS